jgi:diaminopimelate decarboxylase
MPPNGVGSTEPAGSGGGGFAAAGAGRASSGSIGVLQLFPDSARLEDGELSVGGVRTSALAEEHGTPLVVYCEATLRSRARELRAALPEAFFFYGSKAFPNVALLRLFAEEGLGADVASLGELEFARAAGLAGEQLVVHGNSKSDDLLRAAADVGATVALDAEDELERAVSAGVSRALVRVTLGVEADTHDAIRTGHHGSKFGLPPDDALRLIGLALEHGVEVAGPHVHVGSQLFRLDELEQTIAELAAFADRCRSELGWTPELVNTGGGFPVRQVPEDPDLRLADLAVRVVDAVERVWPVVPTPRVALEPGRSLVGQAGVTLYRIRSVKRLESVTWVAVDGGMSDNPRPQLYGARYTAISALRAEEPATETVSVAGLHCESGDVLIDDVTLPPPRVGDVLAVPATGGYTLAMSSNYNATPRPAAVLVGDGRTRVIRRRETIADLLTFEA